MEQTVAFCYSPLIQGNSIRLLFLPLGIPGSEIHSSLIHTTLSEYNNDIYEHYTVLSHVSGNSSEKRTIYVDNKSFQATVNLAVALEGLRGEHKVLRT
jgi:hypothetical protein